MPTVTLTDLTIRAFKPIDGKRVTYLDKAIEGFGVRVSANGVKTYVLMHGDRSLRTNFLWKRSYRSRTVVSPWADGPSLIRFKRYFCNLSMTP